MSSYCVSLFYHHNAKRMLCKNQNRVGWARSKSSHVMEELKCVKRGACRKEMQFTMQAPDMQAIMRLTDGISFLCCRDSHDAACPARYRSIEALQTRHGAVSMDFCQAQCWYVRPLLQHLSCSPAKCVQSLQQAGTFTNGDRSLLVGSSNGASRHTSTV